LVGGLNNGWAVANTTLAYERAGLGAGGSTAAALANPGTIAGDLDRRAGDFVRPRGPGAGGAAGMAAGAQRMFVDLARQSGRICDANLRQDLMRLHTLHEIGRYQTLRLKALKAAGRDIPGAGNIGKLAMSEIVRRSRDLGLAILGPHGTLHAYDAEARATLDDATGLPELSHITEMALFAQGPPIYGGTDQVQRNIIGERVLGLPKEPNNDRVTPWSALPKNA
jgi:alkylation response protein AidB-like acyl-CoA dehydrogenase